MDWLEEVWMEVQDEIDYETEHQQEPQEDRFGTSMHPVEAPQ